MHGALLTRIMVMDMPFLSKLSSRRSTPAFWRSSLQALQTRTRSEYPSTSAEEWGRGTAYAEKGKTYSENTHHKLSNAQCERSTLEARLSAQTIDQFKTRLCRNVRMIH